MKRINPDTGELFRYGDVREDGFYFRTYLKQKKKDGYNKEVWCSRETFLKQDAAQRSLSKSWREARYEERKALIEGEKLKRGCEICGYNRHSAALDFDHLDPDEKLFAVSSRSYMRTLESLKAEMDKCRVLCANCHRVESYNNGHHLLRRQEHQYRGLREEVVAAISSKLTAPRHAKSNSTSGVEGVTFHKASSCWEARIMVGGKRRLLARSKDKFEAICARKSADAKRLQAQFTPIKYAGRPGSKGAWYLERAAQELEQ